MRKFDNILDESRDVQPINPAAERPENVQRPDEAQSLNPAIERPENVQKPDETQPLNPTTERTDNIPRPENIVAESNIQRTENNVQRDDNSLQMSGLQEDVQRKIEEYKTEHPKPPFNNPGTPDYEDVAETVPRNEYKDAVQEFIDQHYDHSNRELKGYNRTLVDTVSKQVKDLHPDADLSSVKSSIKEKIEDKLPSELQHHQGCTLEEARWWEKVTKEAGEVYYKRYTSADPSDDGSYYTGSSGDEQSNSPSSQPNNLPESPTQPENSSVEGNSPQNSYSPLQANSPSPQEESSKRKLSLSEDENTPKKSKLTEENKSSEKQSPLDYVLEKQSTEMPDICDSDGGD